jgi:hypothetical protein
MSMLSAADRWASDRSWASVAAANADESAAAPPTAELAMALLACCDATTRADTSWDRRMSRVDASKATRAAIEARDSFRAMFVPRISVAKALSAAIARALSVAAMPAIAERRKPAKKPIDAISICARNASELRRAYSRGLPGQNPLPNRIA